VILSDNADRWVLFPIRFPCVWAFFKHQEASFWAAEEYQFESDLQSFKKLPNKLNEAIKFFLATCCVHDSLGAESQSVRTCNLLSKVQIPEARAFFGFQIAVETIHLEVSWRSLEVLVPTVSERTSLIELALALNIGKQKHEWLMVHVEESAPFAEQIAACCIAKTVFNAGSVLLRAWLKNEHLVPTFCESGDRIADDEQLHALFCSHLYGTLGRKLQDAVISEMVRTAVEIETNAFLRIISPDLISLTNDDFILYFRHIGDASLASMGHPKIWHTPPSIPWVSGRRLILSGGRRVNPYQTLSLTKSADSTDFPSSYVFSLDDDF